MAYDAQTFLKKVTIFCDTAEQKNAHIIDALEQMKIAHEAKNLLFGDYSFCVDERDFSLSCVIERKANIEELYSNLTHDRDPVSYTHLDVYKRQVYDHQDAGL